ncbi:MAG: hypothetical protein DRO11_03580 [Methanobacteriota archaeon]|nr:MAG: hypothetical protein DRO11_03580 [Euryarchaeota archaeon]
MTILVINNYPDKKDQCKIDQIKKALSDLGKSAVVVSFSEINDQALSKEVEAVILSGSNMHLSKPEHLVMYQTEIEFVRKAEIPVLGICFGHQLIGVAFGSELNSFQTYIKDFQKMKILKPDEIFSSWKEGDIVKVYQYHKDYLLELPERFECLAESQFCKIEAMRHQTKPIYGIQAHIERATNENPDGFKILENFIENAQKYIDAWIRRQLKDELTKQTIVSQDTQ